MFDPNTCYDVAVFGGGLCGFAAARELAIRKLRVALIERRPVLGWEITWAFRSEGFLTFSNDTGWFPDAMAAATGTREPLFAPPITEMVLDREAASAGIALLLYAQPVAVGVADGQVTGVVVGTKSGELPVRARCFVDATENAILWRLAGSRVVPGTPTAGVLAVVLNGAADVTGRIGLGDMAGCRDVCVQPTLWPGEAVVAFALNSCDIRAARRALPGVLRSVREKVGGLAKALVTSVGSELYPISVLQLEDATELLRPPARNLLGAGPWVPSLIERAGAVVTLGDRLRRGADAAEAITMAYEHLLVGSPEAAPLPHSQVARPSRTTEDRLKAVLSYRALSSTAVS